MRWTFPTRALLVAVAVAWLLVPLRARAWHDTGHMIVTQIAYDELSGEARREVDRLVAVLALLTPGRDHAVTASLWPDDLKRHGVQAFDSWHYVNYPYRPDHAVGEAPGPAPENVVWAIRQAATTLRGEAGDLAKSLMLRFLLHFVGDVHQPLHCVNRVTADLPDGDRGGNDFPIADPWADLHAFWDGGAEAYPAFDGLDWRPLVRRLADDITRRVPKRAVPEWTATDPEVWARESFEVAVGVVYAGISKGAKPSPQYAARARPLVRRRLALAGYRLGTLLNDIFGGEAPGAEPRSVASRR